MPKVPEHLAGLRGGFKAFLAPPAADVMRLTVGEPAYDTPGPITEAAISALRAGDTHYTRGEGRESLCRAWASHLSARHGIPVDGDGIVVTPGAKQALLYAMMVAAGPGDEVLILAPAWPTHFEQVELVGATPVHVRCPAPDFHPDLAALEAAITPRTTAMVVCSPSNPTGAVYTPEEIYALVDLAIRHDLWIISDEIYAELIWNDTPHRSPAAVPGAFERTLTITGPTKTHAMTGWRVGILACSAELAGVVGRIQGNACSHIPAFVMPAAEVAAGEWTQVDAFKVDYRRKQARMLELLEGIPTLSAGASEGAFYLMVDVTETGMEATTFATRALEEARVQVIPLDALPAGEGHIRLSYAADDAVIEEGLRRLADWLQNI